MPYPSPPYHEEITQLLSVGFQESSCSMWESESERSHLQDVERRWTTLWIPWIHDSIGDKCKGLTFYIHTATAYYCHCCIIIVYFIVMNIIE
jgi:hypothetical protein